MRISSLCSFYSLGVVLPEVQTLPLALSLSPVQWDLFPALPAFSPSLLSVSISRIPWDLQSLSDPGAHVLLAGAGSIPAQGLGTLTQAGAAAC